MYTINETDIYSYYLQWWSSGLTKFGARTNKIVCNSAETASTANKEGISTVSNEISLIFMDVHM